MDTNNLTTQTAYHVAENTLIKNVYTWMSAALLLTGVTALAISNSHSVSSLIFSNMFFFYGILIAEVALVWYLSARINSLSFATATGLFMLYSFLNGVTLSFIFLMYTQASIASTFFVTAGTFGVMSLYGYFTKRDLTSLGNLCMMALIGLIIATVVNLFMKSESLYWIITYAGVLIFVGLTAYDTKKIKNLLQGKEITEETQKLAILGALSLYLDFINLFIYLLRILGKRK